MIGIRLKMGWSVGAVIILTVSAVGWLTKTLSRDRIEYFLATESASQLPQTEINEIMIQSVNEGIIIAAIMIGLASLIVSLFLVRYILKPIGAMQKVILALKQGDDKIMVPVRTRDELGQLAESFNGMLAETRANEHMRRNMLGDFVHELRTPLTGMRCQLESIRDGLRKPSKENIEKIYRNALQLQQIFSDLEGLVQTESGQTPFFIENLNILEAINDGLGFVELTDKRLQINLQIADDFEATVKSDPKRLRQIIGNLLKNAVVHSPAGGEISVTVSGDQDRVGITIQDEGPGVPLKHAEAIFERFFRTDKSRQRDTGGSGLGLHIARGLARLLGGNITLENPGEIGAVFYLEVPRWQNVEPVFPKNNPS